MCEDKQNKNVAKESNQYSSENNKDYSARTSSSGNSETELANQKIQEQFYGKNEQDYLLPIHVDVNNPPIKK